MVKVGQKVQFDPFSYSIGYGSDGCRGKKVIGKVVYVNYAHGWFSVDYEGQRFSFKFCELGDTVKVVG